MIQLKDIDGSLYVAWADIYSQTNKKCYDGDDAWLCYTYPSGDIDGVKWPNPNIKRLRGALYDAREAGLIPNEPTVRLPDGAEFSMDEPYWKEGDHVTWQDPDDGVCSRTGVLTKVEHLNDSDIRVTMEDGWEAEICESELSRAE